MNEKDLQTLLIEKMSKYAEDVYQLNDFMARNPEIGLEEYESSAAIVNLLRKYGVDVEYPFAGLQTAFRGRIHPEKKARAALLAEYDALRDMGHGCGHCASGCASVLAALAFHEISDQLEFGIDIIGTPDEEITGTKEIIASQGYFDEYDFAIMVHMSPFNTLNMNFIALDGLGFRWKGKAAHAAACPEAGRNALNAARLFMDATDMMRQHVIPEARMHGFIVNGGKAANIVPEEAEVEFFTRAPRREDLNDITAWVKDCAKAAALATRTEVEMFPVGLPFHELHISKQEMELMECCFEELGLPLDKERKGMSGSSDIGNVDYHCPAFHPMMGIGKECNPHTREFAEAMTEPSTHEAIMNSAAYIAVLVSKLYCNPEQLNQLKKEHRAYRGY